MQKPVLLFDFDGVIFNSFDGAFRFNKNRCAHYDEESYRGLFRGNINDTARSSHTVECGPEEQDYFDGYAPHMEEMAFFDGVEEMVKRLAKEYRLFVVSSCRTDLIQKALTRHGVEKEFEEILGNDVAESKVEKISTLLARLKLSPAETIFITDTVGDIREARECGVGSIAVTWGFHSVEWLREAEPLHLVHSVSELESAIKEFFDFSKIVDEK